MLIIAKKKKNKIKTKKLALVFLYSSVMNGYLSGYTAYA